MGKEVTVTSRERCETKRLQKWEGKCQATVAAAALNNTTTTTTRLELSIVLINEKFRPPHKKEKHVRELPGKGIGCMSGLGLETCC